MDNSAALHTEFREELRRILDYWARMTPDRVQGGFYGQLNNDNVVVPGAIKGAVLNARILWSFAAGYHVLGDADGLAMAGRALDYIMRHFVDGEYGGVYWSVTAEGEPADTKKQIYAIAFMIYGLAEYYRAQPMQEALDLAIGLYGDIERYSYDVERGGYMEALTRDWQPIADLRLSEKDANEKKTMNTHLHILEAYTHLYRVWPEAALGGRIRELIRVFQEHIVDAGTGHLRLFFDEGWAVRSSVISYGHDIEASWLLMEAAEVLEDAALVGEVRELSLRMAVAASEGLNADGSMRYERDGRDGAEEGGAVDDRGMLDDRGAVDDRGMVDDRGAVNDRGMVDDKGAVNDRGKVDERHWWVQAEAMVGFLHAAQLTGEAHFYRKFEGVWGYVKRYIVDQEKGEWFWGRHADGSLMEGEDKVGFWKCPYHNSRACIEAMRRLGAGKMPMTSGCRTILLADDDEDDRIIFEDALQQVNAGVRLETVEDGSALLQRLERGFIPDIIFLDLNMPGKNGFDCLQEIRREKSYRDLPIIIFSTTDQREAVDRAYELGANYFMRKPQTFHGLKELISRVLGLDLRPMSVPDKESFILYSA